MSSVIIPNVLEAIFERRSLRHYHDKVVPKAIIEAILTAGTWSPSAHNRQPWRFAVLDSADSKITLARAMNTRLRRDLEADNLAEDLIAKDVQRSYERLTSAPVLIVLALSMSDMDIYSDAKRQHNEYIMAVQSTAMAGQTILLAAHAYGLGACWVCAPLFCPDVVQQTLDLPEDWQVQGLITLGYPAQERQKSRAPLETRLLWR